MRSSSNVVVGPLPDGHVIDVQVPVSYALPNGNLLVPKRAEADGIIGDGAVEIGRNGQPPTKRERERLLRG